MFDRPPHRDAAFVVGAALGAALCVTILLAGTWTIGSVISAVVISGLVGAGTAVVVALARQAMSRH